MKLSNRHNFPFPIGVEYYRAPAPHQEYWDRDFEQLHKSGFKIVRSFTYWNRMEPRPGIYELDDIDQLFDTAAKHDLGVWLDIVLGTHGACPEWLTREHPDIKVVNYKGQVSLHDAHPAMPQGVQIHCYDHPAWKEYGGNLLRHIVNRYKDRPNMRIWGLWDGIALPSVWSRDTDGYPCYCENTLKKYDRWLRDKYTLDELNSRLLRRYRRWEDVEPPRSNNSVLEMFLYRQFHYENLAKQLRWMVNETKKLDSVHETRSHGGWLPKPLDEFCAPHADSWGMSMSSNNLLTSDDPHKIADRQFIFDWARSVGRNNRWWIEEIYAGMSPGGVTWSKQSDPSELTTLLWMSMACGAAGAMFWQYRPEYLSFESPGYNLVRLDGKPTARFKAVTKAVQEIESLSEYLPIECPQSEVAIVYHPASQELFNYGNESDRFLSDLRGVYRTLWTNGIQADVVTPKMDWKGYRLIFLPNVTLMDEQTREKISTTLDSNPETQFVAEGSFGMYSSDGQSSYLPPEGFSERLEINVADVSAIDSLDISEGRNILNTMYGKESISSPCGYAILEPSGNTEEIASLNNNTVGVRTKDKSFTWYGLTLSAGFGNIASNNIVMGHINEAGINAQVETKDKWVIPITRTSKKGGKITFLFNLRNKKSSVNVSTKWDTNIVRDLILQSNIEITEKGIPVTIEPWGVKVLFFG